MMEPSDHQVPPFTSSTTAFARRCRRRDRAFAKLCAATTLLLAAILPWESSGFGVARPRRSPGPPPSCRRRTRPLCSTTTEDTTAISMDTVAAPSNGVTAPFNGVPASSNGARLVTSYANETTDSVLQYHNGAATAPLFATNGHSVAFVPKTDDAVTTNNVTAVAFVSKVEDDAASVLATTNNVTIANTNSSFSEKVRTAAGGWLHTDESRAKISAANKGRVPWNKGRTRSPEEKAAIAAGVRARNRKVFLEKLAAQNITEEEWLAVKEAKKARRTANGGYRPTAETRAKISRVLRAKYADGDTRIKRKGGVSTKVRRKHSEETKEKIRQSLKRRREEKAKNPDNLGTATNTTEVRARISETLKKKWEDPEFRAYMMERMAARRKPATSHRDDDYRRKISESMKAKWADPTYREKALSGMSAAASLRPPSPKKPRTTSRPKKRKKKKQPTVVVRMEPNQRPVERKIKKKKRASLSSSSNARPRKVPPSPTRARPTPVKVTATMTTGVAANEPPSTVGNVVETEDSPVIVRNAFLDSTEEQEVLKNLISSDEEDDDFDLDDFDPYGLE